MVSEVQCGDPECDQRVGCAMPDVSAGIGFSMRMAGRVAGNNADRTAVLALAGGTIRRATGYIGSATLSPLDQRA